MKSFTTLFRRKKLAAPRKDRTLTFENLEHKRMLATITPTTFADPPVDPNDGQLSLREAVLQANATPGRDVIQLKPGTYHVAAGDLFKGDRDELKISDDLEIRGAGGTAQNPATTIQMNKVRTWSATWYLDRVMTVERGASVKLDHVGVTGGNAWEGGGILNKGELELVHSKVFGNSASWGGGIDNYGDLTLQDSVVAHNRSANSGGGIYNDPYATLTVTDSRIEGNQAGVDVWARGKGTGYGGGIYAAYGSNVTIRDSTITNNYASGYGGGLYNSGGDVTVINGGVSGNSASQGGNDFGGTAVRSYWIMAPDNPRWWSRW